MYEGFLQPRHCYRVDTRGLISGETQEDSIAFFNNPAFMHLIIPQDSGLSMVLKPWTIDVTAGESPIYQEFRIIFWAREIWLIMSMKVDDFYSLAVHLDVHDYELTSSMGPSENETGHLEMFPFRSPYFRTVRKMVAANENG